MLVTSRSRPVFTATDGKEFVNPKEALKHEIATEGARRLAAHAAGQMGATVGHDQIQEVLELLLDSDHADIAQALAAAHGFISLYLCVDDA